MGSRFYSRQANGRFRRATLANTFGLEAPTCPKCGRFNPHEVGAPPPETCHACGAPMSAEAAQEAQATESQGGAT